jgi:hypothetical protein
VEKTMRISNKVIIQSYVRFEIHIVVIMKYTLF